MDYPFTKCLHPIRITNKYTGEKIVTGCGKCRLCRANKGFRYTSLVTQESNAAKHVVFVTLTYAPEFLPTYRLESVGNGNYDVFTDDGEYLGTVEYGNLSRVTRFLNKVNCNGRVPTLSKDDLQKFFKRLRKNYGKKVRYFACGEYGPKHYRPHYHLLFFFDSSDCLTQSGHTLSEFPAYTWSKQDLPLSPQTGISDFEYSLRKSWRFGRVDCSLVSQGSCASYVAMYVNSFSDVPPFFALPSSKCFCVHSRFLGRQILRAQFADYIFMQPEQVAKVCIRDSDSYRETVRSLQDIAAVYPRCKGYVTGTDDDRLFSYRILEIARRYYEGCPIDIARAIVSRIDEVNPVTDYFRESIRYHERVTDFLGEYQNNVTPDVYQDMLQKFYDKCVFSVYTELLVSKQFLENCEHLRFLVPSGNFDGYELSLYSRPRLQEFYYHRIKDMYSYLDMMHLNEMYRNQEVYFNVFSIDDLPFFYNNGLYDEESFLQSLSYKVFTKNRLNKLDSMQKHRVQNDLNNIFL